MSSSADTHVHDRRAARGGCADAIIPPMNASTGDRLSVKTTRNTSADRQTSSIPTSADVTNASSRSGAGPSPAPSSSSAKGQDAASAQDGESCARYQRRSVLSQPRADAVQSRHGILHHSSRSKRTALTPAFFTDPVTSSNGLSGANPKLSAVSSFTPDKARTPPEQTLRADQRDTHSHRTTTAGNGGNSLGNIRKRDPDSNCHAKAPPSPSPPANSASSVENGKANGEALSSTGTTTDADAAAVVVAAAGGSTPLYARYLKTRGRHLDPTRVSGSEGSRRASLVCDDPAKEEASLSGAAKGATRTTATATPPAIPTCGAYVSSTHRGPAETTRATVPPTVEQPPASANASGFRSVDASYSGAVIAAAAAAASRPPSCEFPTTMDELHAFKLRAPSAAERKCSQQTSLITTATSATTRIATPVASTCTSMGAARRFHEAGTGMSVTTAAATGAESAAAGGRGARASTDRGGGAAGRCSELTGTTAAAPPRRYRGYSSNNSLIGYPRAITDEGDNCASGASASSALNDRNRNRRRSPPDATASGGLAASSVPLVTSTTVRPVASPARATSPSLLPHSLSSDALAGPAASRGKEKGRDNTSTKDTDAGNNDSSGPLRQSARRHSRSMSNLTRLSSQSDSVQRLRPTQSEAHPAITSATSTSVAGGTTSTTDTGAHRGSAALAARRPFVSLPSGGQVSPPVVTLHAGAESRGPSPQSPLPRPENLTRASLDALRVLSATRRPAGVPCLGNDEPCRDKKAGRAAVPPVKSTSPALRSSPLPQSQPKLSAASHASAPSPPAALRRLEESHALYPRYQPLVMPATVATTETAAKGTADSNSHRGRSSIAHSGVHSKQAAAAPIHTGKEVRVLFTRMAPNASFSPAEPRSRPASQSRSHKGHSQYSHLSRSSAHLSHPHSRQPSADLSHKTSRSLAARRHSPLTRLDPAAVEARRKQLKSKVGIPAVFTRSSTYSFQPLATPPVSARATPLGSPLALGGGNSSVGNVDGGGAPRSAPQRIATTGDGRKRCGSPATSAASPDSATRAPQATHGSSGAFGRAKTSLQLWLERKHQSSSDVSEGSPNNRSVSDPRASPRTATATAPEKPSTDADGVESSEGKSALAGEGGGAAGGTGGRVLALAAAASRRPPSVGLAGAIQAAHPGGLAALTASQDSAGASPLSKGGSSSISSNSDDHSGVVQSGEGERHLHRRLRHRHRRQRQDGRRSASGTLSSTAGGDGGGGALGVSSVFSTSFCEDHVNHELSDELIPNEQLTADSPIHATVGAVASTAGTDCSRQSGDERADYKRSELPVTLTPPPAVTERDGGEEKERKAASAESEPSCVREATPAVTLTPHGITPSSRSDTQASTAAVTSSAAVATAAAVERRPSSGGCRSPSTELTDPANAAISVWSATAADGAGTNGRLTKATEATVATSVGVAAAAVTSAGRPSPTYSHREGSNSLSARSFANWGTPRGSEDSSNSGSCIEGDGGNSAGEKGKGRGGQSPLGPTGEAPSEDLWRAVMASRDKQLLHHRQQQQQQESGDRVPSALLSGRKSSFTASSRQTASMPPAPPAPSDISQAATVAAATITTTMATTTGATSQTESLSSEPATRQESRRSSHRLSYTAILQSIRQKAARSVSAEAPQPNSLNAAPSASVSPSQPPVASSENASAAATVESIAAVAPAVSSASALMREAEVGERRSKSSEVGEKPRNSLREDVTPSSTPLTQSRSRSPRLSALEQYRQRQQEREREQGEQEQEPRTQSEAGGPTRGTGHRGSPSRSPAPLAQEPRQLHSFRSSDTMDKKRPTDAKATLNPPQAGRANPEQRRTLADIPARELDALERSVEAMLKQYSSSPSGNAAATAAGPGPDRATSVGATAAKANAGGVAQRSLQQILLEASLATGPQSRTGNGKAARSGYRNHIKDKRAAKGGSSLSISTSSTSHVNRLKHGHNCGAGGSLSSSNRRSPCPHHGREYDVDSDALEGSEYNGSLSHLVDPCDPASFWCGAHDPLPPPPDCVPPLDLTLLRLPDDETAAEREWRVAMPTAVRETGPEAAASFLRALGIAMLDAEGNPLPSEGEGVDEGNANTRVDLERTGEFVGEGGGARQLSTSAATAASRSVVSPLTDAAGSGCANGTAAAAAPGAASPFSSTSLARRLPMALSNPYARDPYGKRRSTNVSCQASVTTSSLDITGGGGHAGTGGARGVPTAVGATGLTATSGSTHGPATRTNDDSPPAKSTAMSAAAVLAARRRFTDDSDALDGGRGADRERERTHRIQRLLLECNEQRARKSVWDSESEDRKAFPSR